MATTKNATSGGMYILETSPTTVTIDYDKCDGADCAECADVCPMEVLVLKGDKIEIVNPEDCSYCEVCMDVCPNDCIKIEDED